MESTDLCPGVLMPNVPFFSEVVKYISENDHRRPNFGETVPILKAVFRIRLDIWRLAHLYRFSKFLDCINK
jgi:hypothetical protein